MASLERPAASVVPDGCTSIRGRVVAVDPDALDVHLVLPTTAPTGVARADRAIEDALASYGVVVHRDARVARLADMAVTLAGTGGEAHLDDVAFAHVVPHYRAPQWVVDAGLSSASDAGLVDVDHETLRHRRHDHVWSLGDVADLGIRPSGGALRKQVAVLAPNVLAGDGPLPERYDGYTVMPITTARHRLLLVEVNRDGELQPTVPWPDLLAPRRTTWWIDRYALPVTYFRRILRGKV